MARLWAFAAIVGLAWASTAAAGDVYVCKGANGVKSYQNVPCPKVADQLQHETYSQSLARQPATDPEQGAPYNYQPAYAPRPAPPRDTYAPAPAPQPPVGYECTAGRRTWVQTAPCPATYTTGAPITVDGVNQLGQPIHGTGTLAQQAPVQQQALDQDTLCRKVQDGANMGHGWSEGRQSYERNKLRGQLGC